MTIHTIPLHHCFLSTLAGGLWQQYEQTPLLLTDVTVILPSRRLCLGLQEAFLRITGGKALLLPQLYALSDIGEAAGLTAATLPVLSRIEQRLLIARLLMRWLHERQPVSEEQAMAMAHRLIAFLDEMQTQEIPLAALRRLVPEIYAHHWQEILAFLTILVEAWPAITAERGQLDPATHRAAALHRHAKSWQQRPPATPVIAAGITETSPATLALLRTILQLPQGTVLLHGIETLATPEPDPSHPYYLPKQLFDALAVNADDLTPWPAMASYSANDRRLLIAELFRPAALTHDWHHLPPFAEDTLHGISYVVCPTVQAEARTIAFMLRETLETPRQRAAVVTQDRQLARYITSLMERWNLHVSDSAGEPLAATPTTVFLRLIAEAAYAPSPITLLALAKHPLAAAGMPVAAFRQKAREVEKRALRGLQQGTSWPEMLTLLQPLADLTEETPFDRLLATHLAVAESLAATDNTPGAARLWAGDKGEQTREYLQQLTDAAAEYGTVMPSRYPALFAALLDSERYYPSYGAHPRLEILSPAEVRLQHYDRLILAELNEGSWPEAIGADPWLSGGMRAALGLPPKDLAIGQAAHDFAGCFCAPEVILIRAEKKDGSPTVPSRFLARLQTVLTATGQWSHIAAPSRWQQWQEAEAMPANVQPIAPPAPCPPVADRPRRLSVTAVEKWLRDPYALYAEKILGLKPLDPLDREVNPSDFGNFLHKTLERFLLQLPTIPPGEEETTLLAYGEEMLAMLAERPTVKAFWWKRFEKLAAWVAHYEHQRRGEGQSYIVEKSGELRLNAPAGEFVLTAKADRIEIDAAGQATIADYKTGSNLPDAADILQGNQSQMLLEAYIAAQGGFGAEAALPLAALHYWHMTGKEPPVAIEPVAKLTETSALQQAVTTAGAGLEALIAAFDQPETPYLAHPNPAIKSKGTSPYAHLARVKEWRG